MNYIKINGYRRISKMAAKKLFDQGRKIRICPVKCDPTNDFFMMYYDIDKEKENKNFDDIIREYSYYNCNEEKFGKYVAYYIFE